MKLRSRIDPGQTQQPPPVELVPAGDVEPALLDALGADLERGLGVQWSVGDALALRGEWVDAESGLYHSIHLMHALLERADAAEGERPRRWRLAIANAGLCAEGAGEVLGEAAAEGCCAVIGLRPLRRGSGADGQVLRGRLLTEAVHELGHLAGAGHCRRASCVMYPSRHVADTDRKGPAFCDDCRRALKFRGLQNS